MITLNSKLGIMQLMMFKFLIPCAVLLHKHYCIPAKLLNNHNRKYLLSSVFRMQQHTGICNSVINWR